MKYYLIKLWEDDVPEIEQYYAQDKKMVELTEKQLLDLTYGLIPEEMFETIIEWLKEDGK